MTSIIFLFELAHLYDLFCDDYVDDIVEEVGVKGVLKSLIFVVQKANAPKTGVEFRQRSIGAIRSRAVFFSLLPVNHGRVSQISCEIYVIYGQFYP